MPAAMLLFFGDGAGKCHHSTGHKNSLFDDNFTISASFMSKIAFNEFDSGHFEDVAYFEPFYLKDFVATIQRKNIIL
jgi:tRNA threonylcarbamoyladenosine biosynthesis protein TsaB